MGKTIHILGACVMLGLFLNNPAYADSQPIEWKASQGGNGHWYQRIDTLTTWNDAKTAAEGMMITVEGVHPTSESIFDGSYPLISDVFVVVRHDSAPDSRALMAWEVNVIANEDYLVATGRGGFFESARGVEFRVSRKDSDFHNSLLMIVSWIWDTTLTACAPLDRI